MITYWSCYITPNDKHLVQDWADGRIYIMETQYSETLGEYIELPRMRVEDWESFTDWIDGFGTDEPWTLKDLIEFYEERHSPIRWFNKE